MKFNCEAVREAIKQKVKIGQEIAEIVEESDFADEWIKESKRLWVRIEEVLEILGLQEKELREIRDNAEKDYEQYNEEIKKQGEGIPVGTDECGLRIARAAKFTLKQFIEKDLLGMAV